MTATVTAPPPPGPLRKRLRHLPSGLIASAVLVVLGAVLGGVLRGAPGAFGAVAGVLLVAASFTVSSVLIAWADSVHPPLVLPVGLMTYALKLALIGLLMVRLAASGWPGLIPMCFGIAAAALAWTTAQAVWTWRARIPYVEIDGPQ